MPSGLWTQVGPRNHVLNGVQIPMGRGNFEGRKGRPIVKYREYCHVRRRCGLLSNYFHHLLHFATISALHYLECFVTVIHDNLSTRFCWWTEVHQKLKRELHCRTNPAGSFPILMGLQHRHGNPATSSSIPVGLLGISRHPHSRAGFYCTTFDTISRSSQELIRRWDSERELFYDNIAHLEASAYAHWSSS